jgi:C4-dicarboxylate transporter DctM subunit
VGLMSYIVHRIAQEPEVNRGQHISLTDVFMGAVPFVVVTLGILMVLIGFPEMTTWLEPKK